MIPVVAALVFTMLCLCPAADAESCWVLDQTSKLRGKETLTVWAGGMRHEYSGIVTLALAPKWSIAVYNRTSRKVFESNGKSVGANVGCNNEILVGEYFSKMPMREDKPQTVNGVSARHFLMRSGREPTLGSAVDTKNVRRWVSKTDVLEADLWTATVVKPPAAMQQILYDLYKLPSCAGVPMKMTYVDAGGRVIGELSTDKIEKVPLTASIYAIPEGYNKAKNLSEVAVIRSQKQMDGMAELFGNWQGSVNGK